MLPFFFKTNLILFFFEVEDIMDELTIKQDDELFDLETLITEGVDARVPIIIEFPDGRKAQAQIKPISTSEFQSIASGNAKEIIVNVLSESLMNKNGEPLDSTLIEAMPIGLPAKIVMQIFEISGIETNNEDIEDAVKQLQLFP